MRKIIINGILGSPRGQAPYNPKGASPLQPQLRLGGKPLQPPYGASPLKIGWAFTPFNIYQRSK